jgi:glycosyltransferase involved in cell wall biosynthesis
MRVLAITPIFPNRLEPLYGPYNRQQFRALQESCGDEVRVLCAVPYLPGASILGKPERTAKLAALPKEDTFDGLETRYLRRWYVPAVGSAVGVPLYLASLAPHRDLWNWADVILGTWAYPDGCAAVLLAKAVGKPCVVKVHGSDVNVIAQKKVARAVLRRVLPRADALVTVSRAMGDELGKLGVERVFLVPNGIDRKLFGQSIERGEARRRLGLETVGPVVLFVGRIEPQKGIGELLQAFERVHRERPDVTLALVGDGVMRGEAEAAAGRFGGKLRVTGARPFAEMPLWMAACTLVCLPSWNEGTPNVLLEGLASGRPAVGTAVGGIPDVLADPGTGLLVPVRDAAALAGGLLEALARTWDPDAVRVHGPVPWETSAAILHDVLEGARRLG